MEKDKKSLLYQIPSPQVVLSFFDIKEYQIFVVDASVFSLSLLQITVALLDVSRVCVAKVSNRKLWWYKRTYSKLGMAVRFSAL